MPRRPPADESRLRERRDAVARAAAAIDANRQATAALLARLRAQRQKMSEVLRATIARPDSSAAGPSDEPVPLAAPATPAVPPSAQSSAGTEPAVRFHGALQQRRGQVRELLEDYRRQRQQNIASRWKPQRPASAGAVPSDASVAAPSAADPAAPAPARRPAAWVRVNAAVPREESMLLRLMKKNGDHANGHANGHATGNGTAIPADAPLPPLPEPLPDLMPDALPETPAPKVNGHHHEPAGGSLLAVPGIGPGMRLRLEQAGIHDLRLLADADEQELRRQLGDISRLADVCGWIAAAREYLRGQGR